ncbi:hypothetical protein BpHYR1_047477 [Brachionus plicatilis]|uniref:Uncharacterized protein n=1 Tax=Brachionus plicatilis TaxID=10195 RepID=A0A3M7QEK7_BRAPC|nr:hypothetical protein BpHYR1_047477 [Brachionus plicatilis]
MSNIEHESDDDSAPDSVSFESGKIENLEQNVKIKDQINSIRESQKRKRIERQEKFIEQKKKKFEVMKLPDELLEELDDQPETINDIEKNRKLKIDLTAKSKKIFDSLEENAISDFIPLKTYKQHGITVVNLESTNKKPLIASEKALAFKNKMFNRFGLRRENAQERHSISLKRKILKSSK